MKIFIGAHPDFAPRNEFRNFDFNYLSIQNIFHTYCAQIVIFRRDPKILFNRV